MAFTLAGSYVFSYFSNTNNLDAVHDSLIGESFSDLNKQAYFNGDEIERTSITFIDENTAELTQGSYMVEVDGSDVSYILEDLNVSGEFEYVLEATLSDGIVVRINGISGKAMLDDDGNVLDFLFYD